VKKTFISSSQTCHTHVYYYCPSFVIDANCTRKAKGSKVIFVANCHGQYYDVMIATTEFCMNFVLGDFATNDLCAKGYYLVTSSHDDPALPAPILVQFL
jgi:hypothetical protein